MNTREYIALEERYNAHNYQPMDVVLSKGQGGVVVPPEGYLRQVRELCNRHDILLITGEIQSGLGRTGKIFAADHEGVRADVVTNGEKPT